MLDYTKKLGVPENYFCSKCQIKGVKLWRQSHTFLDNIELMCVNCAKENQKKPNWNWNYIFGEDQMPSDNIGNLIPAIPTEDCETFWGYTSVPLEGCRWWHLLEPKCETKLGKEYLVSDKEWQNYLRKLVKEENLRKLKQRECFEVEDCFALVEATNTESFFLWQQWSNESDWDNDRKTYSKLKVSWKQDSGRSYHIGTIDNRPIWLTIFYVLIEDEVVGFWEITSQLADYKMAEEWLQSKNSKAFRTNAINFAHAIHRIKGII